MCFTVEIYLTRKEIENRFNVRFEPSARYEPSYYHNAFALPYIPVITSEQPDTVSMYQWGLVPYWVKDIKTAEKIRKMTFNAKAETLGSKPSFRHAIRSRRCMVISRGFFEWQARGHEKIPYYIYSEDHQPLSFAGLYDEWVDPESGEILKTFTIITTRANSLLEKIHNTRKRMPAILLPENERGWLDMEMPVSEAVKMLEPIHEKRLNAHTISKMISRPGSEKNIPELISPVNYGDDKLS